MSVDQNKEVVILWLEARDQGNWDIINEIFAPDYVCHLASDPEPVRGRDKVKPMNVGSRFTFDIYPTHEPDLLIAEGDLVVHRETVRFKPKDPFRGGPTDGEGSNRCQYRYLSDCRRQDRRRQDCRTVEPSG